jgi:heptosyltransferase-2
MKRIVVRAPQWLGDAVASTVFLDRLRHQNPQAHISVAAYPSVAPVYQGCPSINDVLPLPAKKQSTVFNAAALLRQGRFDEIYILPLSFRTALEAVVARVPVRIGFAVDVRSFLLTQRVPYDFGITLTHRYLSLIEEATLPPNDMRPYYPAAELPVMPALKGPVLGLAPWSIAPARTWAAERFVDVANQFLSTYGGTVVLFGSPQERAASLELEPRLKGPVVNTTGGLDLGQLGTMVRRCDAMLVNDSGLMHVAAVCNVPTVVVFGASGLEQALPLYGRCVGRQHSEVVCVPCWRNRCVRFGSYNNECLKKVTVDEVFNALRALFP